MNIPAAQCIGFAHHLNEKSRDKKSKKTFGGLTIVDTSIEDGSSTILPGFDRFLESLTVSIVERQ